MSFIAVMPPLFRIHHALTHVPYSPPRHLEVGSHDRTAGRLLIILLTEGLLAITDRIRKSCWLSVPGSLNPASDW